MLTAQNLTKKYGSLQVLKGIDLEIKDAEVVSIVGASGAGKSTLLQILGTLDQPDEGELQIDSIKITQLKSKELARFRNSNIGFVFQFHNLLPEFTALENVCLPGFIRGTQEKEVKTKSQQLLDKLRIAERANHKPSEMSGGEQQRVAVARALINNPRIVFADEPSGNLDSKNADDLHKLFFDLRDEFRQTFVIVTHNSDFAKMADRTLEIHDGRVLGV